MRASGEDDFRHLTAVGVARRDAWDAYRQQGGNRMRCKEEAYDARLNAAATMAEPVSAQLSSHPVLHRVRLFRFSVQLSHKCGKAGRKA
jgi:hypothetical protein